MFDNYKEGLLKYGARFIHGSTKIGVSSIAHKQLLPTDMKQFWNSIKNKVLLQKYFVD